MEKYRDGWAEFKATRNKPNKLFAQRLDTRLSIPQLRDLISRLTDHEQTELAVLCCLELAMLFKEQRQLHPFLQAVSSTISMMNKLYDLNLMCNMRTSTFLPISIESASLLTDSADCSFRKAVQSLAYANAMHLRGEHEIAFDYLWLSQTYSQCDLYTMQSTLDHVLKCVSAVDCSDVFLADALSMFSSFVKVSQLSGIAREKVFEVEFNLLLLFLRLFVSQKEVRPRSFLDLSANGRLRSTVSNHEEASYVQKLCKAVRDRDVVDVINLTENRLTTNQCGRTFVNDLVGRLNPPTWKPRIVDESDENLNELDRRKQMFQRFQAQRRKNRLTYQTL